MGRIIESLPGISQVYEAVIEDLARGKQSVTGREGLSAEQVVKLGILRKRLGLTYRGLSEATADSMSVRRFLSC